MNKKGIFLPLLFIFTILIFGTGFYFSQIQDYGGNKAPSFVGESSINLIKSVEESELQLLTLDQIARLSIINGILDFHNKGGYYSFPSCEGFKENDIIYHAWIKNNEECGLDPSGHLINLEPFVYDSFKKYLSDNSYSFPSFENYNLILEKGIIFTGTTEKLLSFSIEDESNNFGNYEVNPNFKQVIPFNFEDFNELQIKVFGIIGDCKERQQLIKEGRIESEELSDCIFTRLNTINLKENQKIEVKKFDNNEKVILVTYSSEPRFFNQPLVTNFALDFNK